MTQASTVPTRCESFTGTIDPTRLQWANWGGPIDLDGHTFVIGEHIPGMGENYTNLFGRMVSADRLVPVLVCPDGPADLAPGARWKVGAVRPAEYVLLRDVPGFTVGEVAPGIRQHPSFFVLLRQRFLRPATPAEFFAAVAAGKATVPAADSGEACQPFDTKTTWGTCLPGPWWTQEPFCGPAAAEFVAAPPAPPAPREEEPTLRDVMAAMEVILGRVTGLEGSNAQLADAVTALATRVSTVERTHAPIPAPTERRTTRSRSAE